MEKELVEVYCGSAKGKTTLGLGQSLRIAAEGRSVIIIQFLKGRERRSVDFLEKLDDLDIKIFRFEKQDCCYDDLTENEKEEERSNILNGLNFARKVIVTQECDFLLLDEILGVIEQGIVSADTVAEILEQRDRSMQIVMTGTNLPEALRPYVDRVVRLTEDETVSNDSEVQPEP
nr:cob(I)yrinic acid a,c-diamide adenosyltransferase [uncultured Blautia sp.]